MRQRALLFVTWVLLALVGAPDTARAALSDDPVVALRQAADRTLSGSFHIESHTTDVDGGVRAADITATVSPARQVVVLRAYGELAGIRVADRGYVPKGDGTWVRFELSRLADRPEAVVYDVDRWLAPRDLYGVFTAKRTGARHYTGVLDRTRGLAATRLEAPSRPVDLAVPFEATLDARGRLVELTEWQGGRVTLRLSEHGRWVRPPLPPGRDIEPADDAFYHQ
ncbi:hypothetical protein SAMN05421812_1117 [Asanoa hainanensis]|uniref:Outer membrane lipoprotein-sorting protein n=1 Tax=Asanoa hainanensis TaxID=560556 RepID=A0A239NVV8_9ACTN|nr:hypothetical protein [Asanoa hainanensis]SNT58484.1 hypothetical protein SAMN05421812_1117 [Asanoa hainanensis]